MTPKVLSVRDLRKQYGTTVAVDGISFEVNRNEIVGLLGPNGAGKTTTINMILGVLEPTSGTILVEDLDIATRRSQVLERTNFAAVYAPLPGNLTVIQNLRFFGMIYCVKDLTARIETLLEQYDLLAFRHVKCGVLSSGEQTRVSLAKAMLNRPALLLLDEPTASLDPAIAREIRIKIREYAAAGKVGVLWTSHNMYEVEDVCDRVLFLSHGRILLQGDPRTLPGHARQRDAGRAVHHRGQSPCCRSPGCESCGARVSMFSFRRTSAIVLRQFYLMQGSPARVLPLFAWVAIDMVTWGFITKYLNAVSGSGFNFVPSLLGAVLLWDFFIRVMQGVTTTFFEDVWSRNFLNVFATPLSIWEYVSGLVLSSIATSSVGLVVMLVLAVAVFGLSFFLYGVLLIPYLLVLFLFGIALGIIGCGIVLRLGPASEWLIWPIPALISPFAGVFYPLSTLPSWMRAFHACCRRPTCSRTCGASC